MRSPPSSRAGAEGDGFALLLDEPGSAARATLTRLLGLLAERTWVSAGVASFPQDGEDADAMHSTADAELYVRKHEGRAAATDTRAAQATAEPLPG